MLENWHNCDGEIGKYLHNVLGFKDSDEPWWALVVIAQYPKGHEYLEVRYCPICGEKLLPIKRAIADQPNLSCEGRS